MGMDGLAGIVFGVVGGGIFARDREDFLAIPSPPPSPPVPLMHPTNGLRRHLLPPRGAPNRDMAVASCFGVGLFSCVGWRFIHRIWTLEKMR